MDKVSSYFFKYKEKSVGENVEKKNISRKNMTKIIQKKKLNKNMKT